LIGNPTNLIRNIGSGFSDLANKPKEGFSKGVLQGGLGVAKGGLGFVRHGVAGIGGTLSRITRAANKPFVVLSFDTEYVHQKEITDMTQKPIGAIDGVKKGG